MKKAILILLAALCIVGVSQAKGKKMAAGVNVVAALPMGDMGDMYKMGFGATGTFMYRVAKQIDVTGTVGYLTFSLDSDADGSFSTIPVLFGGRYYIKPGKIQPYAAAEVGFHFVSAEIDVPGVVVMGQTFGGGTVEASSTEFGFGFGGGVLIQLNKKMNLDAGVQYNSVDSNGFISIEAGISYGL